MSVIYRAGSTWQGGTVSEDICRSCGQAVIWAKSAKGSRWMILERAPDGSGLRGNIVIVDGKAHVYRDSETAIDAYPCLSLYIDHHATCPQAKEWRKKWTE